MAARVMVVNDTPEILDLFRVLLEDEAGYEVALYSYAVMDMREVEGIAPDRIILDYIFGREGLGWQMLQMLKMDRKTATIPVIICTAATKEVQEIEGYLQAQGVGVIPKPFDIDTLLDTVKLALTDPQHDATLLNRDPDRAPDD
ncbi:MAG TPA: response regulator [Ktedonobacterales bacterium]|nr:response regulator [Ktedonobacterales bacterium]